MEHTCVIHTSKFSSSVLKIGAAFGENYIQSGYFAEKGEPGLITVNNNATISS